MGDKLVGCRRAFNYPPAFVELPEYTAHSGMVGLVTRRLGYDEAEQELAGGEPMYEILFDDGFSAHAFESELIDQLGIL